MVAKLIGVIIGIIFIACFAGFNLDNSCNINLLFHTFENVPVFFTVLISFAIGMICALPFALVHRVKKSSKIKAEEKSSGTETVTTKEKKSFFGKKTKSETKTPSEPETSPVTAETLSSSDTNSETGAPV